MKPSIKKAILKRRGRPATGNAPSRTFRLSDEFMATLDAWAAKQDDQPGRSEAIRRLVELGLTVKSLPKQTSRAREGKANAMAGKQLDELVDASASADQQATRKGRLLRGPEEFQSVRIDRPARKK
jgi:predicted transcriptional regulator